MRRAVRQFGSERHETPGTRKLSLDTVALAVLECIVRLEPVQLDGPPGNDFAEIPEDEPIVAELEIVTALFPQTGSQHHVPTIELKQFSHFVAGWFRRAFRLVFGAVQQFAVANDAADGVRRPAAASPAKASAEYPGQRTPIRTAVSRARHRTDLCR